VSNVTLTISGRRYTVACAPGEEEHIALLGAEIDSKLEALGNMQGQSEARTLLFAALLLADELHEVRAAAPGAAPQDDATAKTMETLADRLERLADRLENESGSA
jgi:cell division protein ZapA